ncbi:ribosomal-protein-alanine N-acetyltransferase [Bartonella silvatica]|uniref:Ribosomal-protein-alanine N-acetyltransferase n=1 Tax=Bartonella silvatica TaxID=357760 RepID=A0ABV2HGT9_9HYPH
MSKLLLTKERFRIAPLQTDDSVSLYKVHQNCFIPAWEKQDFDYFLTDDSIFGHKVSLTCNPDQILGFSLCRLIVDEAEIITIAVHPQFRRQGIGSLLIDHTLRYLYHKCAIRLFLEVEETNISALKLYQCFGFQKISKRLAYYPTKNGRIDAIVMQKTFKQID